MEEGKVENDESIRLEPIRVRIMQAQADVRNNELQKLRVI